MLTELPRTTVIMLCLVALGCGSHHGAIQFPGYTNVNTSTAHRYLIDRHAVSKVMQHGTELLSFPLIAPEPNNSYRLLHIRTDCSSLLANDGGSLYQADGTMLQSIAGDDRPIPLNADSDLGKVALDACQTEAEKNYFGGDFESAKAMLALFKNYDSGSKSSQVTIRDDSGEGIGTVTTLLNTRFDQQGIQKHLMVISTKVKGDDCHACGARIGAYVFIRHNDRWIQRPPTRTSISLAGLGKGSQQRY